MQVSRTNFLSSASFEKICRAASLEAREPVSATSPEIEDGVALADRIGKGNLDACLSLSELPGITSNSEFTRMLNELIGLIKRTRAGETLEPTDLNRKSTLQATLADQVPGILARSLSPASEPSSPRPSPICPPSTPQLAKPGRPT